MDSRLIVTTVMGALFGLLNMPTQPPKTSPATQALVVQHEQSPFEAVTLTGTNDDAIALLEETRIVLDQIKNEQTEMRAEYAKRIATMDELVKSTTSLASFQAPTTACECQCVSKEELRTVIREELDKQLRVEGVGGATFSLTEFLAELAKHTAGLKSTTSQKQDTAVTGGVSSATTVADPVVISSAPIYSATTSGGSTGGSVVYSSPVYSYSSPAYSVPTYSGGSAGGSSSTYSYSSSAYGTASPVASQTRTTTRRGLLGGTVTRSFGPALGTSRYYVNEYGCTVDRQTGKVVSCPVNR